MDDRRLSPEKSEGPPRKRRRLLKWLAGSVLLGVGLVLALPWLLGTPPARAWIVGRVNSRLAPGSIRLGSLGLSWTGSIRLDGLALLDSKGKTVLASDRLTLDRGLLGLIASRPDYGTITVEGAKIDLERRSDGSIDLLDAIASLMKTGPAPTGTLPPPVAAGPAPAPAPSMMAVSILIRGGTFQLKSPELVEPIRAGTVEGSVTIAPGRPTEVIAKLTDDGRSLEVHSTIDPGGDLKNSLATRDWPIHVRQSGVLIKSRLRGTFEARRAQGLWSVQGDPVLSALEAYGPTLQGDRLRFDEVSATCDIEQTPVGWSIRKLDLTSPVATLQGNGTIPAIEGTPTVLVGKVDLAALAKLIPNALNLRDNLSIQQGAASVRVEVKADRGVDHAELTASLDDFEATEAGRSIRLRKPVFASGRASRSIGKVKVEALEVKAAGVDVKASGDLDAGVNLAGTVDLPPLMAQLGDILDLGGVEVSGKARIGADYRHVHESYKGRFAVEVDALKVVGASSGPIERPEARLEGWAIGPARVDGIPDGWQQARLDLRSADLRLHLGANAAGEQADLAAGFEMTVTSPVAGKFDATARFHKAGSTLEIHELVAALKPTDPSAASGALALAVRGKFDPSTGSGTFGPIPGQPVAAIGLGAEGLKVSGVGQAGRPVKVEGAILGDLGALDRLLAGWSGSPARGLGGLWAVQIGLIRSVDGKVGLASKFYAPDLILASDSKGPVSLTVQADYQPEADRLTIATLDLGCTYAKVGISGGMVETKGRRFFDLGATVEPFWTAIDPLIASKVEPEARIRAKARTIHLAGSLQGDQPAQWLNQVIGEAGLDLTQAQAFGVTLGATPVTLRFGQGLARFDPIRTTLNGGPVSIVADLALDGEHGVWLRLGSSKVDRAAINQAVSGSILAYVAPVLARSTGVTGQVTVVVDRAFIPITAAGSMSLDGAMALQDVTFQPGPLAGELTSLTGRGASDLKLNEAMFVKVRDSRVEQHGLSIPLGGKGVALAIDGSVGFDETLDLQATIPIGARSLGLAGIAGQDSPASTVTLPIRGNLTRPSIDRKALSVALRKSVEAVGEKRLKSEATRFLERLAGPGLSPGEPRTKP